MRFLLYSKPKNATTCSISKKIATQKCLETSSASPHFSTPVIKKDKPLSKAWGQKCAPDCGCIIRFETTIDTSSNQILSATMHTKSLVKDSLNNPLMTSKNRPMLKKCDCYTLNNLGKQVTAYLPNKKFEDIRNMTEFEGVRSSDAFRHAVLQNIASNESSARPLLLRKHLSKNSKRMTSREKCYDIMEDAFLAMIRGHMPSPRKTNNMQTIRCKNESTFYSSFNSESSQTDEEQCISELSKRSPPLTFNDFVLANFLSSDWKKENILNFYRDFFRGAKETYSPGNFDERNHLSSDMPVSENDEWLLYIDAQEENKDEFA